LIFL
jgi:hypothetical protein